ncbi:MULTISPECIES: crotonase/enoyl-CoA hydratase family protein [unclassified Nocardioides]|uniref:crotonase/enoyl-CoA hydratase family protein n=1 Tax=unclassified Nocardioides TaxID=2615069 RepID=UPI0006FABC49|nr:MULTISPECIES: crotonase/enoyl-CoA hydratase family protein [unclassified Nocardioides]KRA38123.1 enoyl-CoA hydratase [Nocardioides sp. Root614]KRA92083.1 enoyl-CoA hydratase [Nocardioides sp. Root682]
MTVVVEKRGPVTLVTLSRPEVRNAVDAEHARLLTEAFEEFDADESASVAVLYGAGGVFCAGADLKAVSRGDVVVGAPGDGPDAGPAGMGPSRMLLSKPVIAAIDGYAVAGGLELALWCDLRVVDPAGVFGVFCRRWGVPLIDGGTFRLPRLIGHSHALDLILTGREVAAEEALRMGLANRVSAPGAVLDEALALATQIAGFPQTCMREDRLSSYETEGLGVDDALAVEWKHGLRSLAADTLDGASRFAGGAGRHGAFE